VDLFNFEAELRGKSVVAKLIGLVVGGLVQFIILEKAQLQSRLDWSGGLRSCSIYNTQKSAVAK
jgi:hypothetical protein